MKRQRHTTSYSLNCSAPNGLNTKYRLSIVWARTARVELLSLQEIFLKYNSCQVTTSVSKVLTKLAQKLPLRTAQLLLSCTSTDTLPQEQDTIGRPVFQSTSSKCYWHLKVYNNWKIWVFWTFCSSMLFPLMFHGNGWSPSWQWGSAHHPFSGAQEHGGLDWFPR